MIEYNILGVVENWMGLNRDRLKRTMDNAAGEEILFNIASEGGDVMEGLALAGLISDYEGKTTAKGFGIVASIATVIMAACDEKKLTRGSFFMIHNSWAWTAGNKEELAKDIELMEKIDEMMANIYVAQIEGAGKLIDGDKQKTFKAIKKMMKAETWLTAEEAYDMGFIDGIIEETEQEAEQMSMGAVARLRAQASTYKNLPIKLQNNNSTMKDKKGILNALAGLLGLKAEITEIQETEETTVNEAEEPTQTEAETTEAEAITDEKEAEAAEEMDAELVALKKELEEAKANAEKLNKQVEELQAAAAGKPVGKTETKTEKSKNKYTEEQIKMANAFMSSITNR